jgi:hypothetical protein
MNLLDIFLNPDKDEFPDRTVVVDAANLLQIGEFQFLQLAFAHWHGRDMRPKEADAIFESFMIYSEVPNWALMYATNINQLERDRNLDGNDPNYHRFDVRATWSTKASPRAQFATAVVFLVGTLGGALFLANQTAACSGQFPPCVNSNDIPGTKSQ